MTHPDNRFYGHGRILASAAGVDPSMPLRAHVQHGWSAAAGLPERHRLVGWLPRRVWSGANLDACRARGITRVEAIGAPFLYLLDAERGPGGGPVGPYDGAEGTVVYPFHGWDRQASHGSHHELAACIAERETGPVTVVLYVAEHDDPAIRGPYEQQGFRIECHGRREDPAFLHRQLATLRSHRRVVSNHVSTALWYGAALGMEAQVYGPPFSVFGPDVARAWGNYQRHRWPELFDGTSGSTSRELAGEALGADHLRGPAELRSLLGWEPPHPRRLAVQRRAVVVEHRARTVVAAVAERRGWLPAPADAWLELLGVAGATRTGAGR